MMRRSTTAVVLAVALGLAACATSGARRVGVHDVPGIASRAARTTRARVVKTRPFDGTGSARLLRDGPNAATWHLDGVVVVTGIGRAQYHQRGSFTAFQRWTAEQTLTAPNGDSITATSVGGVISSTSSAANIQTVDTVTGGTGRFAGARGQAVTNGETTLAPNGVQVFVFGFRGTITVDAARATPLHVVRREIIAFNQGDVEGSVSLFAVDAQLVTALGGCEPCVGRETIRDHWSRAIANQSKIGIRGPKIVGRIVTASSWLRSPTFPDGIDRAIGTLTATVVDGQITRWDQQYDLSDPQTARLFAAAGLCGANRCGG